MAERFAADQKFALAGFALYADHAHPSLLANRMLAELMAKQFESPRGLSAIARHVAAMSWQRACTSVTATVA
jgi:hypothetical protein